jgi:hypothetical protein
MPIVKEYSDDWFFGRFGIPTGQSVVVTNGHYITTPYPWLGEIYGLTEGVDWFQGGRVYEVSDAVATQLAIDGFMVGNGYGIGAYGIGAYGDGFYGGTA